MAIARWPARTPSAARTSSVKASAEADSMFRTPMSRSRWTRGMASSADTPGSPVMYRVSRVTSGTKMGSRPAAAAPTTPSPTRMRRLVSVDWS